MSTEAALAALYPPSGHQVWNEDIPWQPIPVHTVPKSMDRVSFPHVVPMMFFEQMGFFLTHTTSFLTQKVFFNLSFRNR